MDAIILVSVLICSVVVHEVAHAWQARREGDYTADKLGRITLNPISHLDPVGSFIVPLALHLSGSGFLFGWAKPVDYSLHSSFHIETYWRIHLLPNLALTPSVQMIIDPPNNPDKEAIGVFKQGANMVARNRIWIRRIMFKYLKFVTVITYQTTLSGKPHKAFAVLQGVVNRGL